MRIVDRFRQKAIEEEINSYKKWNKKKCRLPLLPLLAEMMKSIQPISPSARSGSLSDIKSRESVVFLYTENFVSEFSVKTSDVWRNNKLRNNKIKKKKSIDTEIQFI